MQISANAEQALRPKPLIFGLTLQNIPIINLRQQYARDRESIFVDGLEQTIQAWKFGRSGPATVTFPEPDAYYTMLLRSTIVGIECTLQHSALEELLFTKRLTERIRELLRHPNRLSSSTADAYYNRIPAQVDSDASLRLRNKKLWKDVHRFYGEVRNPLSHGFQLCDVKEEPLRAAFDMFDRIYTWIDSWSDPNRLQKILRTTTFQMLK